MFHRTAARIAITLALVLSLIWQPVDTAGASPAQETMPVGTTAGGSISVGNGWACMVNSDGSITCWGRNDYGQTSVPAPNSGFVEVTTGTDHACGLKVDGSITCWGRNDYWKRTVVPAPNSDFVGLSSGVYHTCGLKSNGSIICWGRNHHGQTDVPAPNSPFIQITSGGYHACGLMADGSVLCWGNNEAGQHNPPDPNSKFTRIEAGAWNTCGLGTNGSITCWGHDYFGQSSVPAPNDNFVQISAGWQHSCGLKANGTIICWGQNNIGQSSVPAPNDRFVQVSAEDFNTCGLKVDGSVVCWGENYYGLNNVPAPNSGSSGRLAQISAGGDHTCGLKANGTSTCWGDNYDGQSSPPAPNSGFTQVSAGLYQTCWLRSNGTVNCRGWNNYGQGVDPSSNGGFVQVSAGRWHNCGLKSNGSIACWGRNDDGERNIPAPNSGFKQVAAGGNFTCGLKVDGTLRCWGYNYSGQINIPAESNHSFVQVAASDSHTCGVKADGSILCWGWEGYGVLNPATPNSGFTQVSARSSRTCAVRANGTTSCWGFGEPLNVPIPNTGFTQISVGSEHACALAVDGGAVCWVNNGFGSYGQAPAITLSPTVLAEGTYGEAYTQTFSAAGGTLASPSYRYFVFDGALPPGISLSESGELSGTPIQAGKYGFTVHVLDNNGYLGGRTYSLTVAKATPTATGTLLNPHVTYDGDPKTAQFTIDSSTPGSATNIRYNGSGNLPVNAGTYAVIADFTPDDTANYNPLLDVFYGTFTIDKAIPDVTLTLEYLVADYTGQGIAADIEISGVAGSVTNIRYNGSPTLPVDVGDYAVTADFIPSDTDNYLPRLNLPAGTFNITRAIPSATLNLLNPLATYDGAPQDAGVAIVTASTSGTLENIRYSGSTSLPTQAGMYAVAADFIPTDISNYQILADVPAGNFVIAPAVPDVTLSVHNSPEVYNGAAQSASIAISGPPGSVSNVRYDGSPARPVGAGTYAVTADYTPNDTVNYLPRENLPAGSFTIEKAVPAVTLTLRNPPVTYDSTAQAADIEITHASVLGTLENICYDGSPDLPVGARAYAVTADFIPGDTDNYQTVTELLAGTLVIEKANLSVELWIENPQVVYNGAGQGAIFNYSGMPGSAVNIRYNASPDLPVGAGTYAVSADFQPSDTANYLTLADAFTGTFTIEKASLTVSAEPQSRKYYSENPPLTYTFSGFLGADDAQSAGIQGEPEISTDAALASPIGTYRISIGPGNQEAPNYTFTLFIDGVLTVWGYQLFFPALGKP